MSSSSLRVFFQVAQDEFSGELSALSDCWTGGVRVHIPSLEAASADSTIVFDSSSNYSGRSVIFHSGAIIVEESLMEKR